jgi:hypothetical protein
MPASIAHRPRTRLAPPPVRVIGDSNPERLRGTRRRPAPSVSKRRRPQRRLRDSPDRDSPLQHVRRLVFKAGTKSSTRRKTGAREPQTEIDPSRYDHNLEADEGAAARERSRGTRDGPRVDQSGSAATENGIRRVCTGEECGGGVRWRKCCTGDATWRGWPAYRPTAVRTSRSPASCSTRDRSSTVPKARAHGASPVPWSRMDRNTATYGGELLVTNQPDPGPNPGITPVWRAVLRSNGSRSR